MISVLAPLLGFALFTAQTSVSVELRIEHGVFTPRRLLVPAAAVIHLVNRDAQTYILEGPGVLPGDVEVPGHSEQTLAPRGEAGTYTAVLEEIPDMEVQIRLEASTPAQERQIPFDYARDRARQPVLYPSGQDPAYASFTSFNLAINSEANRQRSLEKLYLLSEELAGEHPPSELAPYLTAEQWRQLRPSVSLMVALGASAYDGKRFGVRVAQSKPAGLLTPAGLIQPQGAITRGTPKDVLIRAASDSAWFNQRVCRLAWERLGSRIKDRSLQSGYSPPNGRSPILGGFFDGTGNPSGALRERAVFGSGRSDTFLTWFRVRFDEAGFRAHSLAEQERIIGRERASGKVLRPEPGQAHRTRAKGDGAMNVLRMPVIFDEAPDRTGLLFVSVQASLSHQFEAPFRRFMLNTRVRDALLRYTKFEEAAYYYVPSSPHGSYPGSLRSQARG